MPTNIGEIALKHNTHTHTSLRTKWHLYEWEKNQKHGLKNVLICF